MSQTTALSGAQPQRFNLTISDYPGNHFEDAEAIMTPCVDGGYIEYAAVAALIARNAELEAERNELERLCDATYVQQGADAYHHACKTMEVWQEARFLAGKDRGCEGSLCDGLSWLQSQVTKLEDDRDTLAAENKALRKLYAAICENGDWDEGCFYYNRHSASELGQALREIETLARTPAKGNDSCDSAT